MEEIGGSRSDSDAEPSHSRRFAKARGPFEFGEAFGLRTLRVAFSLPQAFGKLAMHKVLRRAKRSAAGEAIATRSRRTPQASRGWRRVPICRRSLVGPPTRQILCSPY